jgi:uncharacterized protein Veg
MKDVEVNDLISYKVWIMKDFREGNPEEINKRGIVKEVHSTYVIVECEDNKELRAFSNEQFEIV